MEVYMQYSIPRPVFNKLEKSLGDKQAAEELASSMESAVNEIRRAVDRETVDNMNLVKSEIKDDLSKTLVTRELFEERFLHVDEKFRHIDEKFRHLEEKMNLKFHLLIGICIAGFSLFNPGFIEIVKLLLK